MSDAMAVWQSLVAVDKLTVQVIVDNETDSISSPCCCCSPAQPGAEDTPPPVCRYTSEMMRVGSNGGLVDFNQMCYAGHGLSLLLTVDTNGNRYRLLFDAGPTEDLWARNAEKMRIPLNEIGAAVLSHWHPDHSGGLPAVAELVYAARSNGGSRSTCGGATPKLLLDVHPDYPLQRGVRLPHVGPPLMFVQDPHPDKLAALGCRVESHTEPHALLDNCFYVSGAIPRLTKYETGQRGHVRMNEAGAWEDDPLIMDERYVAVNLRGKGPILFSACSHAGVINVLSDLADVSNTRVHVVVGGLHLVGRDCEARIDETIADLVTAAPDLVLAGHCTGWRAKAAMAVSLPGRFQTCAVGATYVFRAARRVSN